MMDIKKYVKQVGKAILNKQMQQFTMEREYIIENVVHSQRFENKVAVVTGASGAIGGAIAWRLGYEGAEVFLGGRNTEKLSSLAESMMKQRIHAHMIVLDVTDVNSIDGVVADVVSQVGKVDILVNCAGGSTRSQCAALINQSVELIDEMLTTNLRGSMLCTRAFGKVMAQNGSGKIVNIASVIGDHGKPKFSDYAASKAGIIGYTKSVAQELGPLGINVNCVSPGFIQRGSFSEQQLSYLLNSNFMHKVGNAEDIASAVAYLVSDEAGVITGQNLCVDGGRSLGVHGD